MSVPKDSPIEMLVANDPETLDPRYVTDAVGLRATRLVHAGLFRLDPDTLAPVPCVARSWTWIDTRTLRIELRSDVFFHSGSRVTARDVIETLRATASPDVASRHAGVVDAIADATEAGPTTVVIRLGRRHATLLSDLELPILRADEARSPPASGGGLDGLGPYRIASVARGEIRLSPAAHGAFPEPARSVVLRTVHDENTRALRLETGKADVGLNVISPTLLPALASSPGLALAVRPGANLTYIVVNESRPPLDDARARQAVSLAIDRKTLCESLFGGHAQPAAGLIAPTLWAHAEMPPLGFDRGAAAALAEAADMDHRAYGRPGRLTLLSSTERLRVDVARVVAQELEDAQIHADVVPLDLGVMIARLNAGDFDLAILEIPEMTEPNVLRHFLHSEFVPPAGANRGRVHDAVLDALLDEGDAEIDPTNRRRIYSRLEERQRSQMHLVPLWYEDQVAVIGARAQTFVPSAEGRWLGLAAIP
jgi:peptide/nickel transport system substrate-binding protein